MTAAPAPPRAAPARRPLSARGALWEAPTIGVALLAMVPALLPLLSAGLPATHDGLLHVQRIIALDAALREGSLLPRWLPDLAYGYGQPLLLYYAPLSYVPSLAARALGAGYAVSLEISAGLALLASVLAMYLLARAVFGRAAACAAAVVYGSLPYQLVDVYVRGALAETWAFVWLPLAALCLLRAWNDPGARWSAGLAVTVAGLVLTHNVTALLYLPALLALAVTLYARRRQEIERIPWRPLAGLALGLGLSAWFWLPAIAERNLVQIGETIEPELFASFFLRGLPFRLDLLFNYTQPVSTALSSTVFWPQLGLVQALITSTGAVATYWLRGRARRVAVWAIVLVAGGMLLQLAPAAPLYDIVPLLAFVQFPWRLLALVGLGSAILAGALVEATRSRLPLTLGLASIVMVGSAWTAIGSLNPEMDPADERFLSAETSLRAELADQSLGTTHSGEYLPVSSGQRNTTRFRKTLLDDVPRSAQLSPSTIQVRQADWRASTLRVAVDAPTPDRLILHQFNFPGWAARVDGVPSPVVSSGPLGLVGVDVPAGSHRVEIRWGWTSLQVATAILSIVSALLIGLLVATRVGRRRTATHRKTLAAVAFGGVLAIGCVVTTQVQTDLQGSYGGTPSPGVSAAVDESLALLDAQHDTSRLADERIITTSLLWLVRQPVTTGVRASLEVVAANGQSHRTPLAYEPLSRLWVRGEIVPTVTAIRLPPDFPNGPATLRLPIERPANVGPVELGQVMVPAGQAVTMPPTSTPAAPIGRGLTVAGYSSPTARAGGPLDVVLRWEATESAPDLEHELLVVAALATPGGDLLSEPGRPGEWFAPLPFWQRGDLVEQRLRIVLPASLAPGRYALTARVFQRDLARGGASEPGASSARVRGRPAVEVPLGEVTVLP